MTQCQFVGKGKCPVSGSRAGCKLRRDQCYYKCIKLRRAGAFWGYFKKMHREGRLHEHVDPTQAALVILGMWFAAMLSTSMAADAAGRRMQAKQFTTSFRQVVFRALVKS